MPCSLAPGIERSGGCGRLTASVAPQVPKDTAAGVAAAATAENFRAFTYPGISVSSPKIVYAASGTGTANDAPGFNTATGFNPNPQTPNPGP